ncbi:MAG: hypothetical protein HRT47_03875 [Candidatus Caenarcaniphilales bacterium]|nr:hypothetical protein [Candidatus Caenarcaniphilales bacterium]
MNNNFAENSLVNLIENNLSRKGVKSNSEDIDHVLERAAQENSNIAAIDLEEVGSRISTLRDNLGNTGNSNSDVINTANLNDDIASLGGDDTINSGNGDDLILSGVGDDLINSGNGNDILDGGSGDDTLNGGNGNDRILGGAGDDLINGGNGDDTVHGGLGDDEINGGNGNDYLSGGAGNDILDGGNGDDFLVAGTGSNTVIGGNGNDTVIFEMSSDSFNIDYDDSGNIVITDASDNNNSTTVSGVENFIFLSDDGEEVLSKEELIEFIDNVGATQGNQANGPANDNVDNSSINEDLSTFDTINNQILQFMSLDTDLARASEADLQVERAILMDEILQSDNLGDINMPALLTQRVSSVSSVEMNELLLADLQGQLVEFLAMDGDLARAATSEISSQIAATQQIIDFQNSNVEFFDDVIAGRDVNNDNNNNENENINEDINSLDNINDQISQFMSLDTDLARASAADLQIDRAILMDEILQSGSFDDIDRPNLITQKVESENFVNLNEATLVDLENQMGEFLALDTDLARASAADVRVQITLTNQLIDFHSSNVEFYDTLLNS